MPFNVGGNIWNGAMAKVQNSRSIITRGLVLHLDAGAPGSYPGSGTTWSDLSGNGNNSTLEESTMGTVSASLQTIAFKGDSTQSNVTEYVTLPLADLKDYTQGSLELFYKINSTGYVSPYLMTMSDGGGPGAESVWSVGIDSGNYRYVYKNGGSSVVVLYGNPTPSIAVGNHYHVVFTSDGSTNKIYHDGNVASGSVSAGSNNGTWFDDAPSPTTMEIGHYRRSYTSHGIEGEIPIFRIYDRALTGKEVLQNFNAQRGRLGV